VAPTGEVDSRITTLPEARIGAIASAAASIQSRFGDRSALNGFGTAITNASAGSGREVARSLPKVVAARSSMSRSGSEK
jgi:hypothetical protein